jgi:hypothetical protein
MDEWNREHQKEIEEFVDDYRKILKTNDFYNIKHTRRIIKPSDQFILQYYKHVLKYRVGKKIDTVIVEHYIKK